MWGILKFFELFAMFSRYITKQPKWEVMEFIFGSMHKISRMRIDKQQCKAKICSIEHKTRLLCHLECPFLVGCLKWDAPRSTFCAYLWGSCTKWRCIGAV